MMRASALKAPKDDLREEVSELRTELDRMQRINDKAAADPVAALDEHYEQGYNLMASREARL